MAINSFFEEAPLKEAASGGAECNRAATNLTNTKAKKVLCPTRKPGQPSPKAEDSRLYSNRRAKGDCVSVQLISCASIVNSINSSHLTHVPPIMHAIQWVQ